MSGKTSLLMATLAVLAAAAAAPASAQQLTITYSGTVTSLVDPNGLFGTPTTDGTAAFTDTFVFDLGKGLRVTGSGFDQLLEGSAWGLPGSIVSSTLTINGVQESFPGAYSAQAFYQSGQYVESTSEQRNSGSDGWRFNSIHINLATAPSSLDTSFSGNGSGDGSFFSCDFATDCNVFTETFGGEFEPTSVAAVVAGVPEPATWAMLILGLAIVGLAARRRRVVVTA